MVATRCCQVSANMDLMQGHQNNESQSYVGNCMHVSIWLTKHHAHQGCMFYTKLAMSHHLLTHYRKNDFCVDVTFSPCMHSTYHIPSSVRLSGPKLHTSALIAILYTFMTQTTPTH